MGRLLFYKKTKAKMGNGMSSKIKCKTTDGRGGDTTSRWANFTKFYADYQTEFNKLPDDAQDEIKERFNNLYDGMGDEIMESKMAAGGVWEECNEAEKDSIVEAIFGPTGYIEEE